MIKGGHIDHPYFKFLSRTTIITFNDYTALKTAQLELEKYVEELKRSNANLEQFAYAASHDLKEPVRKILLFGNRLRSGLDDRITGEEIRYFDRLEKASQRMGDLIDNLLSYSQISIEQIVFEQVDVNKLVEQVLEDLDLEIEEKKAIVKVDELFTLQGNERQLQQAFQNLIGNELKYNKPGIAPEIEISCSKVFGKSINLSLSPGEQQKEYYNITISDNGIEFESKYSEKIFNVFTRLHGNSEYLGTGIGLSIVRKVVENHKGFITAESEPGQGATFKVFLPAV